MAAPFTERSNVLSEDIDIASPVGIVRILRQIDAQMFAGFEGLPCLNDDEVLTKMCTVADAARDIMKSGGSIILSGCGTSGRMAHVLARAFNALLEKNGLKACFKYFNAGGDAALFRSTEAPEDNWSAATEQLKQMMPSGERCLYIGITCGLSAPAVAGQLKWCMDRPNTTTVLLGFNAPSQARRITIEGWSYTFHDIVQQLIAAKNAILLTPAVGPEGITGSTRMKGGSATKFLLEAIFALSLASLKDNKSATPAAMAGLLWQYETYLAVDTIAAGIAAVGNSLQQNGRLFYLSHNTAGLLSIIDASECPPTYNAHRDHVRAFLADGYTHMANADGDMSARGPLFQLGWDDFERDILPTLSAADVVVVIDDTRFTHDVIARLQDPTATIPVPLDGEAVQAPSGFDPAALQGNTFLAEIATKLVLNALTTGGHILKGKIVCNRMVDVQVSNTKLYHRAVGIVSLFGQVDEAHARDALLRSIYEVAAVDGKLLSANVSSHVTAACAAVDRGRRVVPTAIVLARKPALPVATAIDLLAQTPQVRKILASLGE